MVMEPKYLAEEVIVDPNHPLTRWLDPRVLFHYRCLQSFPVFWKNPDPFGQWSNFDLTNLPFSSMAFWKTNLQIQGFLVSRLLRCATNGTGLFVTKKWVWWKMPTFSHSGKWRQINIPKSHGSHLGYHICIHMFYFVIFLLVLRWSPLVLVNPFRSNCWRLFSRRHFRTFFHPSQDFIGFLRVPGCSRGNDDLGTLRVPFGKIGVHLRED